MALDLNTPADNALISTFPGHIRQAKVEVQDVANSMQAQVDIATASAAEALASANNADISEAASLASEQASAISAAQALASEQAAGASEVAAALSASAAATSEQNSAASEQACILAEATVEGIAEDFIAIQAHVDNIDGNPHNVSFENIVGPAAKIAFDTALEAQSLDAGEIAWNPDERTFDMGINGVTLQAGQEVIAHVRNNTASLIANGTVCMATGTIGASGRITVAPMDGTDASKAMYLLGIATEDIAAGSDGFVTVFGKIRGINTSAYIDGDILYTSNSIAGGLTKVAPTTGLKQPIAFVVNAASNGVLFVRIETLNYLAFAADNSVVKLTGDQIVAGDKTFTGNTTLGDAEATDTHAVKGATTVLANSTSAALTVTQTGTGNAFVVEDSTSPDSTPFVINESGNVIHGDTSFTLGSTVSPFYALVGASAYGPQFVMQNKVADASPSYFVFRKDRAAAVVVSGDAVGAHTWNAFDGTKFKDAAQIIAYVDGTPGTNDMPGRLVFSTTADGASTSTERMRIDSAGTVTFKSTTDASTKDTGAVVIEGGLGVEKSIVTGGSVGIGGTPGAGINFTVAKPVSGATTAISVYANATIQSDVTLVAEGFRSRLSTAAETFTLPELRHFHSIQNTIGAGSTVTSQYGFYANANLVGATNNYGFYSNIADATGRYNFYAAGTAANYFAGDTSFNATLSAKGITKAISAKTTAYTAAATDHTLLVTGSTTITLPAAASNTGRIYVIKKTDTAGTTVTVDGNASETIDGSTTVTLTAQYQSITIQCDGSNWYII